MNGTAAGIVLCLSLFASGAGGNRAGPLRIGAVYLREGLWKEAVYDGRLRDDRKLARLCGEIPRWLGPRRTEVHTCLVGRDNPELEAYDLVVLLPEWTNMLPPLDRHAAAFHRFVRRGGGLVVFQPNPRRIHPAGARPSPALRRCGIRDEFCTPKLLPLRATFHNQYVRSETVAVERGTHPIVAGLSGWDMPFPSDRLFDLHEAYVVLARGERSRSASLATATFGDGRIVLFPDNLRGNQASRRAPAAAAVRRALLWAAGASDEEVRSIPAPTTPLWPTTEAVEAIRAGKLRLEVARADTRIATFEAIDLRLRLRNDSGKPVRMPANWPTLLAAEVVPAGPEGGDAKAMTWTPGMDRAARRRLWTCPPAGSDLTTRHRFPCRKLTGRPAEWPYLPAGTYRFRLQLCAAPPLRTRWQPLEVTAPTLDDRAKALATRAPRGRLLIVEAHRVCPVPDGSIERPYSHLADALKLAKAGDVVYCGRGRHRTLPAVVPDGVLLAGAGAANTVVVVSAYGNRGPGVQTEGACRIEDLTLTNGDTLTKGLLNAKGRDCRAVLLRCVLMPDDGAPGGVSETVLIHGGAVPTFRNCILVSRVGSYAALVTNAGTRPTFEYCTIVSRGFGAGVMDAATPTLRRCIIAGQCPGILVQIPCECAVAESVLWCRGGGATFRFPITRWRTQTQGDSGRLRTIAVPDEAALKRRDVHCFDPKLNLGGGLERFLRVPDSNDAAAYGAYAGPDANWPAASVQFPGGLRLPDLKPYLYPDREPLPNVPRPPPARR